jgi:hypothetical protein
MNYLTKQLTKRKMKLTLPNFKLMLLLLTVGLTGVFLSSCEDDEKPKTVPVVTTGTVTEITTTTATLSGEITSNGNAEVTVTGFVYSSIAPQPTIADSKVELTDTEGDFSTMLEELGSGTTYHVRAYATNSVGIGYGEVVDFTTGNAAPTATEVSVTGEIEVNKELTATYNYDDSENDVEGESTFKWYVADDAAGTGETPIEGATELTYVIQEAQQGKYIRFGVTPKAATGSTTGTEVKSAFVGAVGEATTVTFTYNGQQVTYGILNSAATTRKWLDRNLGAPDVATAADNYQNYGHLFQWGRGDDGHQVVTRTGTTDADVTGSGMTSTTAPYQLSSTDNPGHSLFIVSPDSPSDWRSPENPNLWQGVDGINNPCPDGWRIPTREEWAAEGITNITDGYTKLKLTFTGFRAAGPTAVPSQMSASTVGGYYQTTTIDPALDATRSIRIRYNTTSYQASVGNRAGGYACRCIKD